MFSPGIAGSSLSVPAAAASWGMTRRVFFDDFVDTSKIDLTNSKAPGFNWYLSNSWPNSTTFSGTVWQSIPTISPANISVANSILTINGDPTGFRYGLGTAVANGASYTGRVFPAGLYFEFRASLDNQTPNSGQTAAVWSIAMEFLTGSATKFGELDFLEANPTNTGDVASDSMHLHEFTVSGGTISDCEDGSSLNQANPPVSHNAMSNMATFGTLWVPAALNGGTGIVRRYYNNSEITSVSPQFYSPTDVPNPAPGNKSPAAGQFSAMDAQNLMVMIGADSTIPISIDWVGIWSR